VTTTRVTLNSSERFHKLPNKKDDKDETRFEKFYFLQAADCQFGMIDNYLKKLPDPKWDEEVEFSERLVERCNKLDPKPKFMVICGDLVDAFPGTALRGAQVEDLKRVFSKLDPEIPLVCVCGNHDIGNEPTRQGLEEYWRDFGDDYFYFITNGVLFIVIDSQFYEHRAHLEDYAIKQDTWLENLLGKCKQFKYSIVFQHIPWYLNQPEEDKDYFNIDRDLRLKWLKKFREAGVDKVMCGHYHRNAGGWYDDKMELVVTSAIGAQLGDDKSGIRVVKCLDDKIEHHYVAIDDIPGSVEI